VVGTMTTPLISSFVAPLSRLTCSITHAEGSLKDLFDSMKGSRRWTGNAKAEAVLQSILTSLGRPKWGIASLEAFKAAVAEGGFDEIWNDVTQGTGWDELLQYGLATIWLKRQIDGVSNLLI
jgi:hypothetical protein